MATPADSSEIVKRALAYPEAVPGRSFLQVGERTLPLRGPLETAGRTALLAYGSNAAPPVLARKLAPLPAAPLPVVGAALGNFDVAYSAHVSPHGAVPGTLRESAGTTVRVAVLLPSAEQLRLLSSSEPNYELQRLEGLRLRLDSGERIETAEVYLSRHGCLELDGDAVALAAIEARRRRLPAIEEAEMLERVRAALRPELPLERFVLEAVAEGGIAPLPERRLSGGSPTP